MSSFFAGGRISAEVVTNADAVVSLASVQSTNAFRGVYYDRRGALHYCPHLHEDFAGAVACVRDLKARAHPRWGPHVSKKKRKKRERR